MNTPFVRKLLQMRSVLVINLVVLFFLSLSFGRTLLRNASIQQEIDALEAERSELMTKNSDLLSLAEQLQTKFFVEKEGRKKYGLQKDGEQLVIVTETETALPADTGSAQAGEEATGTEAILSIPNPQRWWWYFFNRSSFEQLGYEAE